MISVKLGRYNELAIAEFRRLKAENSSISYNQEKNEWVFPKILKTELRKFFLNDVINFTLVLNKFFLKI